MIKALSVTLFIFLILSIAGPNIAIAALPCNAKILDACYKSCKELFDDPLSLVSCYGGCLIGCITSGKD
jgi:hypothetical protein